MELKGLSVEELSKKISSKELSAEEVAKYYLSKIEQFKDKNAVLEVFEDALEKAKEIDQRIAKGEQASQLAHLLQFFGLFLSLFLKHLQKLLKQRFYL